MERPKKKRRRRRADLSDFTIPAPSPPHGAGRVRVDPLRVCIGPGVPAGPKAPLAHAENGVTGEAFYLAASHHRQAATRLLSVPTGSAAAPRPSPHTAASIGRRRKSGTASMAGAQG